LKSKVKINPSKCYFLVNKLIFLGNLITPQGIGPDTDKVTVMLQYPAPTDQKKLRCVLGQFQFYKKFIPRYSHMVQTLNRLLGKDVEYKWTSVENDAFMELRKRLKNAPFMDYPTANGKFTLIPDASKTSTGYLLHQESIDGVQHLIACGGRSLHPAKRNYTITELELLSIIEALDKYRHYLLGTHFVIKSDHVSLQFLNSLNESASIIESNSNGSIKTCVTILT